MGILLHSLVLKHLFEKVEVNFLEYPNEIKNRLKRIEGQVRGVLRMMEEGNDCQNVINQLSAIRSAVDKTTVHVIGLDMGNCLIEDLQKDEESRDTEKIINDAIMLLLKTR